jgi:hypothetical protein
VLSLSLKGPITLPGAAALPHLRHFKLYSWGRTSVPLVPLASQLIGSGCHLTHLCLDPIAKQEVDSLEQLGVMPVLKELSLWMTFEGSLVAAEAWLLQQPQLTSLVLTGFEVGMVEQLPPQLVRLSLRGRFGLNSPACAELLQPLVNLRTLCLCPESLALQQLPNWLSRLRGLEEVVFDQRICGCEVLQQLPFLRCYTPLIRAQAPLVAAAPHLCWSRSCCQWCWPGFTCLHGCPNKIG